jgi:PAS domain S-box-containing protein
MALHGPVQVLMVEDSVDDALLATQALRHHGLCAATTRVDTEAGLRAALTAQDWDIVLCDQSMPRLDVTRVLEVLGAHKVATPVVLVTGTVGEEIVAEMMRRGIVDVVLKDRMPERLGPVVEREVGHVRARRALERSRGRSEAVLAAFGTTAGWQEAAHESLRQLADGFAAQLALMTEIVGSERRMHQVACWSEPPYETLGHWLRAQFPRPDESIAGRAMLRESGVILQDLAACTDESRFAGPMVAAGVRSQVSQSFQAGGLTFIVTLLFAGPRDDLDDVLAELAAISAVLQPLLLRKIADSERSLLLRALGAARSGVLITEASPLDLPGPRIVFANRAVCEMSGHTEAALLGQTPRMLQGELTDPATLRRIRVALDAAAPISVELRNHRADGTPHWVELDITPVFDEARLTHFIAIQTDVTQRRAEAQERDEREASFRLLFEGNPMPMWVCDADTLAFLEVNGAAVSRYGWSREAFLSRTVHDVSASAEHNHILFNASGHGGVRRMFHATHFTAAGETMAVRVAGNAITWQGRPAILAAVWDVTEMERTRLDLRRKNEALAELTETLTTRTADLVDAARLAGMGTWAMELEPFRVTWSPETFAILGQDPLHFPLTPERIHGCIHPDDLAMFREGLQQERTSPLEHRKEYRIVRPSGETRLLREVSRPRRDGSGRIIGRGGVIQDITDQKLAADALLRAEKLKTIGQITGGIAHDFNNLLNVIGLNLESALEAPGINAGLRDLLEPALHAARRSAELTGQMLSYARRQSLRPVVTDLGALVAGLQPLLVRAVGERHMVHILPQDGVLPVSIDPGQFENALMNLAINARDALGGTIDRTGRIEIGVTSVQVRDGLPTQPDAVPPGSYARVRVADTGSGIDPAILPRILEPFFTTKPLGTGSGLGLSMVYGFVHQSQGRLSIDSTPGAGTRMDLYFPLVEAPHTILPPRTQDRPARRLRGHALLVEDRDDLRATMLRIFRQLGFETEAVESGEAALERLRAAGPIDLLFTDILLPGGIDGATLAEAAERLRPGLAVVLTSGDTRQVDASRLKWPVLPKPFRVAALIEALGETSFEGD